MLLNNCLYLRYNQVNRNDMKKITLALMVAATSAMTACEFSLNKQPSDIKTESASLNPASFGDAKHDFKSPDGQLLDVRGNVTKLLVRSAECDANRSYDIEHGDWTIQDWAFDASGNAKRTDLAVETKVTRNGKGQQIKTEAEIPDMGRSVVEQYEYNEQGMVATEIINGLEWGGKKTYKYDADLNCLSATESSASEGRITEETTTYEIKERDDHGNWTKRYTTTTVKSGPDNGSGKFDEEDVIYGVDIREISYKQQYLVTAEKEGVS